MATKQLHEITALPLWVRVGLYACAHHAQPLGRGELRLALDPTRTSKDVSVAIARALKAGLLAPGSTARCLYSGVAR